MPIMALRGTRFACQTRPVACATPHPPPRIWVHPHDQSQTTTLLSDLKNQTIVSSCVTHILPSCGYFKGQEEICFNPTSWHLVTYNFL